MIKNIIQTIFNKGFVAIINLLILIIASKLLGVSTQGQKAIFILNISNIQIINEVFTGFSLVYFIPRFDLKKLFTYGILWTIIVTGISNGILLLLGKEIAGFELDLYLLSLLIILNTFNMVIILGKENIKLFNILSLLQPFLLLFGIAFYTMCLHDYTFRAYVIPLYISFTVVFIISLTKVISYVSIQNKKTEFSLASIFKNGFFCQLAVLFHLLANRRSYYILETISMASVGLYSTASTLMESSVLIISNGIAPVILSKISSTGDTLFNQSMTLALAKVSFLLSCLAAIVVYLLPTELFVSLLGIGFKGTREIMLWIAPGILFVCFSTVLSHYFSGIGNLRFIALCNFMGFICTISLAPFLIKAYGLKGAAMTANISYFVSALALLVGFFVKAKLNIRGLFSIGADVRSLKQAFTT
jgi:O-antigen/teichoic acid export membrane protein